MHAVAWAVVVNKTGEFVVDRAGVCYQVVGPVVHAVAFARVMGNSRKYVVDAAGVCYRVMEGFACSHAG